MKILLSIILFLSLTVVSRAQNSEKSKEELSVMYFDLGKSAYDAGEFQSAVQFLSQSIDFVPDFKAYFWRGGAKFELNDYRGAIKDFDKTLELHPNHAIAFAQRGISKGSLGNYSEALIDLNKSIKLQPKYPKSYEARGLIKIQLKDKNGGCLDLSKAGDLGSKTAFDNITKFCN